MSHFTPEEIAYLRGVRLGRLATVNAGGEPHIAPVGFRYNPELDTIDIGGGRGNFGTSRKFKDARATGKAAFVVDDVDQGQDAQEWHPRGIEIRGTVEAHESGYDQLHPGMDPAFLRIRPTRIISWGINAPGYHPNARSISSPEDRPHLPA
jgi:pyridoxamine 5'-phosphate oxidase family protein